MLPINTQTMNIVEVKETNHRKDSLIVSLILRVILCLLVSIFPFTAVYISVVAELVVLGAEESGVSATYWRIVVPKVCKSTIAAHTAHFFAPVKSSFAFLKAFLNSSMLTHSDSGGGNAFLTGRFLQIIL